MHKLREPKALYSVKTVPIIYQMNVFYILVANFSHLAIFHNKFTCTNATINVKPEGGGGGVGRATHGNLTVACIPRVGILIGHYAFHLSILQSRREVNQLFLLILTIFFRPGVGILIIFISKCRNPHPMPDPPPPPLGLDTDRCIIIFKHFCKPKKKYGKT